MGKDDDKEKKISQVTTIRAKVVEGLKNTGDEIAEGVTDELVEKELARRKGIIGEALAKFESMDDEHKKMKPDNNVYDEDENIKVPGWTKSGIEAKNKLVSKMGKLEKAIDGALNDNNYKGLEDVLKKM